jgi:hypothetical protein
MNILIYAGIEIMWERVYEHINIYMPFDLIRRGKYKCSIS